MSTLYALRVIFISAEALVLGVAWLIHTYLGQSIESFASTLNLNEEVLKYLMMLPAGMAVWVINESRLLLQEDKESIRILTAWTDYWKLKTHTSVSLGYAVLYAGVSFVPWAAKSGISTGTGMLLFVTSILGQLFLAVSVYMARIRVNEILAHAK